MIDVVVKETKPKMQKAIDNFKDELTRIRTGRANPSILDGVMVSYYGATSPLREIASISVPESNQILIKPWDRGAVPAIETAIRNSSLGLSPINDGTQIRLVLPPMTGERRKEIAVTIKKIAEETKVSLRQVRREIWDSVQSAVKNKEATEDDRDRSEKELNKLIDEMNHEVDRMSAEKEKEVTQI